jgi:hypothetical protein
VPAEELLCFILSFEDDIKQIAKYAFGSQEKEISVRH